MTLTEPTAREIESAAAAHRLIEQQAVKPGAVGPVGIELERFVIDLEHPLLRVEIPRIAAVLDPLLPLPGGSSVTFEPGGQLELSGPPHTDSVEACEALARDLAVTDAALLAAGLRAIALGADPYRPAERILSSPRYEAMHRYFDAGGPAGAMMMCSTAALQVNLEAGTEAPGPQSTQARWARVHALAPVLTAAFANSPLLAGRRTGWQSSRAMIWSQIDACRTRAVGAGEPRQEWARYALAADVMLVRDTDCDGPSGAALAPPGLTLEAWADRKTGIRPLHPADIDYHLTTLFPPVRPRGFYELRFLDSLPSPWWEVAVAVTCAVMDDDEGALRAEAAYAGVGIVTPARAALGMADPAVAKAADQLLEAAAAVVARQGSGQLDAVEAFRDRFTRRGRCPADDLSELVGGNEAAQLRSLAGVL
jgi:glutamate--cysteine ligase